MKKIATGVSALALLAALSSCSIEVAAPELPAIDKETATEGSPVEEASEDTADSKGSSRGYQAIYDEYSARLQNECPNLALTECAELANEGVSEMAKYMYSAKGTDGQYATYEEWSQKLYDVYMSSAQ